MSPTESDKSILPGNPGWKFVGHVLTSDWSVVRLVLEFSRWDIIYIVYRPFAPLLVGYFGE